MVSIKTQVQNFGAAVQAQAAVAKAAVANGAQVAGQKGAVAAKAAGLFMINPTAQKQAMTGFANGVDRAYKAIGTGVHAANDLMENEAGNGGVARLRQAIAPMSNLSINRLAIDTENDTDSTQSLKRAANKIIGFHEAVVVKGEKASRVAGDKAHALTRAALTPVAMVAKVLQVEVAGQIVQNAVALAVGFAVRGIVLALSQLGHLVPYIAAAAAIGAAGFGLVVALKAAPIVTGFALMGSAIAALSGANLKNTQQIQALRKDLKNNTYTAQARRALRALGNRTVNAGSAIASGASTVGNALVKNKGKVAAATATAAAAAGLYFYAPEAIRFATMGRDAVAPYATAAYERVAPYATSASNAVVAGASTASAAVTSGASTAKDFVVENAGKASKFVTSYLPTSTTLEAPSLFARLRSMVA